MTVLRLPARDAKLFEVDDRRAVIAVILRVGLELAVFLQAESLDLKP